MAAAARAATTARTAGSASARPPDLALAVGPEVAAARARLAAAAAPAVAARATTPGADRGARELSPGRVNQEHAERAPSTSAARTPEPGATPASATAAAVAATAETLREDRVAALSA